MAAEVVWLDDAKDDLLSILEFISRDKPKAAAAYVGAISQQCHILADFPESGPAYDSSYRALVVEKHIVLYRYDRQADTVLIAAVVHGRRDIARIVAKLPH